MKKISLYGMFAILSIIVNLGSQYIFSYLYTGPYYLVLSLIVGTFLGLFTKYILDKKYIFNFVAENKVDDIRKFILYSFMGIVTTVVFWSVEYTFYYFFGDGFFRYLGGFFGLLLGYIIKFLLDKKFVFKIM